MSFIEIFRLLLDFGLLVLIWMVQLLVYPAFAYYQHADLVKWHQAYTPKITYIVFPLMLGQLLVGGWQVWQEVNAYTVISILIIIAMWASTMLVFVPIHGQIASGNFDSSHLQSLILKNWFRTVCWTALFIYSLLEFIRLKA